MGWNSIEVQARAINGGDAQLANFKDLIAAANTRHAPQSITISDYDGSVSLHWIDTSFEIAIYADHYESYQFEDGETAICHWPHAPGDEIDAKLLEQIG